ncbi:MAG: hypothetical protein M1832_000483 [Thelocarpon impressellum]|nr:MAG: hypothetical protein M1832_000483 [Thelocarpon impressellum]
MLDPVLDFDARVPVPFSVFPSSYRSDAETTSTTQVKVEGQVNLPSRPSRVGREEHISASATLPSRRRAHYEEEEDVAVYAGDDSDRRHPHRRVDVTIEEERRTRPRDEIRREDVHVYEDEDRHSHRHRHEGERDITVDRETSFEFDRRAAPQYGDELDVTEREYRQRVHADYAADGADFGRDHPGEPHHHTRVEFREDERSTVDPHRHHRLDMGYYDDDGEYHSFRHGVHKAADRLLHPRHPRSTVREEVHITEEDRLPRVSRPVVREEIRVSGVSGRGHPPNTIVIPCHHIRVNDLVMLQGRPCQVIRITTSAQTGQHRYLGVDLFTKQLHEESSFTSNPSPSVIVQSMLGPVFKQYRVLDIRDDGCLVAMTETGDVKQDLPVIDQGGLWTRLNEAFANGRGSVRALVITHRGRELTVDFKVVHGSRL